MTFDTKFAIVIASDLPTWQKLNVVAFLSGGVTSTDKITKGSTYSDASDKEYLPLGVQPTMVLKAQRNKLLPIVQRANRENEKIALFIEDMFTTGDDESNRNTVKKYKTEDLPVVGIAICAEKKLVDKIIKGAKLHD